PECLHSLAEVRRGEALAAQLDQLALDVVAELPAGRQKLGDDIEQELIELRRECFTSEDFREGVQAFGDKRPPRWQNR
ncbi:MAG TPA: hypothetical protein VHE14_04035, partial [Solirubrobacteraceae bacterium]|nr:hypothetical protein [Solirubrobacteraceae bacterium]